MSTTVDFIPISVATLTPSSAIGLDLYQLEKATDRMTLYRGGDYPLTVDDLSRLRRRGTNRLFITCCARTHYQDYLRSITTQPPKSSVTSRARISAMNEVVRDLLQTSFDRRDDGQTVEAATELGRLTADIVLGDEFAIADLFEVLHHDYATFTHSTNVAFYAATLASKLGHTADEVQRIVAGGLLHDLGKLDIPENILCKPGRLDESEFNIIKSHPLIGFRRMIHRHDLCEGQMMMIYQHHEKLDGSGYPVGATEDDIHPWAKLCTVVDVFEALTSQRPYRRPMTHDRAISIMQRDSEIAFDGEVLQCWIKIIQSDLNP